MSTGIVKSTIQCQRFFLRLRCSWLWPEADTENSYRTQEKPLVPRTLCPLSPLCALVNPCDPCVDFASPSVHYVP